MKVVEMIRNVVRYISEGANRLFSPNDDAYPKTGVQPYDGDDYSEWVESSKR